MGWNQPRRVNIPWMATLSRLLGGLALPDISGRSLWVVGDYSFDNPTSDFDIVGLLVADPETSGDWSDLRRKVRENLLGDRRRMSWKKLNSDSRRRAAFIPFFKAADHIRGLSVALAFHRDPAFEIPTDDLRRLRDSFHLSVNWKARKLEQMFRIAYCTAMLVAGLSKPGPGCLLGVGSGRSLCERVHRKGYRQRRKEPSKSIFAT